MKRARLWWLLALVPGVLLASPLAYLASVLAMDVARELWPPYAPSIQLLGWDSRGRLVFTHQEYYASAYDSGFFPCGNSGLYAVTDSGPVALVHGAPWCSRYPAPRERLSWAPRAVADSSAATLFSHLRAPALSPDGLSTVVRVFCPLQPGAANLPAGCPEQDDRLRLVPVSGGAGRVIGERGDRSPAWSNDGRWILIAARPRVRPLQQFAVLDAATGHRRVVVDGRDPALSEDGRWIAFIRTEYGDAEYRHSLRCVRADGTGERVLFTAASHRRLIDTYSPPDDYPANPVWSPDGRFIAFLRTVRGKREIWRVNADGTGLRRVTGAIPPA
ncbi:TolB family protein [Longimicrobium terrae]|uniref:Dipeptidylpeptidase IV N-terminal domain-containing protein n=1 Tax=Longimicrobium terrae TaxID=1639882 RepID=A0A841GZS3_9BACT|nr:PD40 domain-containing protein [Longimicrobium terrae]MBB4636775.1 hypothetical protein [Longimicrobium terrae]MBB6071226.1 hypothetical protein [Longimicrobium terrae]NNC29272.1 hypothetical protein [Longimicrobium terrae]